MYGRPPWVLLTALSAAAHPGIVREGADGTIQSYHVHVQYLRTGSNSTAKAMRFRDAYIEKWGNATCNGLFDQDRLCVYPVEPHEGGIFMSGNWAAYVPLASYAAVVSWSAQHRGDLSILLHPNSGQHLHDHFRWSTWVGLVWPMNVEAFSQFGAVPGEYCTEWECVYGSPGGWAPDATDLLPGYARVQ